ncbi:hypothetical protein [Streptomyces sp. NPDC055105]|uniref:hypothetical protein n=1 Tax=Streptomyces sp. NPDC055105 TaxID=3365719 RepID=UPI0037D297F8
MVHTAQRAGAVGAEHNVLRHHFAQEREVDALAGRPNGLLQPYGHRVVLGHHAETSIHRSLDGTGVVNYVHWADGDYLGTRPRAGAQDPEYRKHMEAVRRIATAEPHSYEVVAVVDGDAA